MIPNKSKLFVFRGVSTINRPNVVICHSKLASMSAAVPVNRRRRRVPTTQEGCSRHPERLVNVRDFPTITLVEWCRIMSASNILWGVDKYVGATGRLSFSSILIPGGFSFADLAAWVHVVDVLTFGVPFLITNTADGASVSVRRVTFVDLEDIKPSSGWVKRLFGYDSRPRHSLPDGWVVDNMPPLEAFTPPPPYSLLAPPPAPPAPAAPPAPPAPPAPAPLLPPMAVEQLVLHPVVLASATRANVVIALAKARASVRMAEAQLVILDAYLAQAERVRLI